MEPKVISQCKQCSCGVGRCTAVQKAGVVFLRKTGNCTETLLVKNLRGRWSIPKGKVHKNENLEDAAKREALEETRFNANKVSWAGNFFNPRKNTCLNLWIAQEQTATEQPTDRNTSETKWIPLHSVRIYLRGWLYRALKNAIQHSTI